MRIPIRVGASGHPVPTGVLVLALTLLAGCPVDITTPGDVAFGEYLAEATIVTDECDVAEEGSGFTFRARVALDLDGETAWLSLANPPEGQLLAARRGSVTEAGLIFVADQSFPENCGCGVIAKETITLTLVVEEPEEPCVETEEQPCVEPEPGDDEEPPEPPIAGQPHPDQVIGIAGTIDYLLTAATDCEFPSDECTLPCTFDYSLVGARQKN